MRSLGGSFQDHWSCRNSSNRLTMIRTVAALRQALDAPPRLSVPDAVMLMSEMMGRSRRNRYFVSPSFFCKTVLSLLPRFSSRLIVIEILFAHYIFLVGIKCWWAQHVRKSWWDTGFVSIDFLDDVAHSVSGFSALWKSWCAHL